MTRWMALAAVIFLALATLPACGGGDGGDADATATDTTAGADTTPAPDAASPDTTACVPDCAGKACGDDGCGGSCGACYDQGGAVDASLCQAGTCCAPQCGGKTCGDNGCGGQCGVCYNAQGAVDAALCVAGTCQDPAGGGCTDAAFVPVKSTLKLAEGEPGHPYLLYQASNAAGLPRDNLFMTLRPGSFGGPEAPGTYDLSGSTYNDAGIRLLLQTNCTADAGCEKTFLGTGGTLTIYATGGTGVTFRGTLDATLERVTIDAATGVSTPASPAESVCLKGYSIEGLIKPDVPEPTCVPEGTGPLVNDNIADFQLQNCNGETFSLHSLCGQQKAIWLYVVAGWCPVCNETLPQDSAYAEEKVAAGKKLRLVTVLAQDAAGNAPSLAYCKSYATNHGFDPAWTFVDPNVETTFSNVYVYPSADGSFGFPWCAFLDGDNMGYVWHSEGVTVDTKDPVILNKLLSD